MSPAARAEAHNRSVRLAAAFGAGIFVVDFAVFALFGLFVVGFVAAVFTGVIGAWLAYTKSTDLVLSTVGATPINPSDRPRLTSLVEGLSILSGVSRPRLHLIETPAANVLVVGHDGDSASLVVTSGLLEQLNRVELEGVLAHAMSRLDTGEAQVTTVAAGTIGLPILLAERWRRSDGALHVLGQIISPLALLVAPMVSRVLEHDLEVRADLAGIAITRFPPGLAAALDKLVGVDSTIPASPSVMAPLHLLPPFASADDCPLPGAARHLPVHRAAAERAALLREL